MVLSLRQAEWKTGRILHFFGVVYYSLHQIVGEGRLNRFIFQTAFFLRVEILII